MGLIVAALILVLLLVFILQNTKSVKVSYFTASGTVPLGVLLMFATVGGVLLSAVFASLRILQIRRRMAVAGRASAVAAALVEPRAPEGDLDPSA